MADYNETRQDTRVRMDKTVEALKKDFSGLRTGRASTALLDGLMVEAYGAMTPLSQVGTVSVPESRMLSVQVWDRSLVKSVEKAIRSSDLGLNPMNDGQLIRIPIPPLNEERRIELTKIAAKYTEQARIAVRNIRRDAMDAVKKMQKDGEISEDDQKKYETEIQNMTDATIKTMDEMLKVKDQEIKQV
ncbi:MAG TPA: ribosome recycling factor [Alphaproteobacteria bacterium]|nr:ribosome recycling factor [Alphaproteobacteria bacterium]